MVTFRGITWGTGNEHAAESPLQRAANVEEAHAAGWALLQQYKVVEIRAADGRLERVVAR